MEPIYFRPNKTGVIILVILYIISVLTYYFGVEVKDQYVVYLLAVTLPLSFIILFVTATRQVIITEHTITLRKFGHTHTASFYKIRKIEYRQNILRGGRYLCISYANQFGMTETMKINGDYNLDVINDIIEESRRII